MRQNKWIKYGYFLSLVAVSLAASQCNPPAREIRSDKPNIIFILADDLGYADLGCYGQEMIKTPNLDRMAEKGIRFTDFYAGSSICAPSRATLILGKHTGNLRSAGQEQTLLPDDQTVAGLLKGQGYSTGIIGKWGLGEAGSTGVPWKQGFDFFYGFINQIRAHNFYPDWLWRNQDTVNLSNKVIYADSTYARGLAGGSTNKEEYAPDLFTAEAIKFIENNQKKPFFLYLAHTLPHANNQSWTIGEHGMEVPDYGIYADEAWPDEQKGYAAMVTYLDSLVGVVVKKVDELGLSENTLIIFTSDNGPHAEAQEFLPNDPEFFNSNGPLRGMKRDLYEGGIRVPMLAVWPGHINDGSVSVHPAAFWDVLPTACELAGANVPVGLDGISFLPALMGGQQPEHDYLFWSMPEAGGKAALRHGDWKLVSVNRNNNPRYELYDLKNDLGEQNNLFEEREQKAKGLIEHLNDFKYGEE